MDEPRNGAALQKAIVLVIPAGTPHWYTQIISPVTYLETRFDVEKPDTKTDSK